MSLRSRLRRLRDLPETVVEAGGDLAEQVRRAHAYLDDTAPVLTSAVAASLRLKTGTYDLRRPMRAFERVTSDIRDVGAVTREPAAFAANRALGIDSPDNPFGGQQELALERAAKGVEGPLGVAARTGQRAFSMGTDFTNLAGGSSGGLGRVALRELGSAAAFGGTQSLAEQGLGRAAERLGISREGGETAGSLLGAPIALGGARVFASRIKALREAAEGRPTVPDGALGALGGGQPPRVPPTAQGGAATPAPQPSSGPYQAPLLNRVASPILSAALPSALRDPEITKALRRENNWSEYAGTNRAVSYRKQAQQPVDFLDQQARQGLITETPVQARIADRWEQSAVDQAARDRVHENRLSVPAILENPNGFNLTAEQRRAVDRYHALTEQQFKREEGFSAAPQAQRDNYVRHVYETDPRTATIRGGFGAKQAQMKQRTFDTYLEAMSQGYVPKSLNAADLMEARVKSGERAIAQKQLADTINAHPEWVRDHHAEGFQQVDIGARGVLDSKYIRKDIAEAINVHFAPRTNNQSTAGKVFFGVTGAMRSMRLGWDLAMTGRLTPQALAQGGPVRGTSAVLKAYRDSMMPGTGKRVEDLLTGPVGQEWGKYMRVATGDLGDTFVREPTGLAPLMQRNVVTRGLLKVGQATQKAEDWQFGTFVPALKIHLAEELYRSMKKHVGAGKRYASEEVLKDQIGRRVDTLLSGFDPVRAGITKNQAAVERLAFLSPAWARGVVANLTDITKGGAEGQLARRFWATTAFTAAATTVGLNLLTSGDDSPENITQVVKDALDPRSKNFLGVHIGDGNYLNIWGPVVPIARVALTPLAQGVGEYAEVADAQGQFTQEALMAGLQGFLGGGVDAAQHFAQGRRSVPVGIVWDVTRNKTFNNRAIATAADEEERRVQKAVFAMTQLLPSISGLVTDTERVNQPEWDVSTPNRMIGAGLQALGTSFRPGPRDPAVIQATVSTFLRSQGVEPGQDPVGAYGRAISEGKVNTADLAEFQAGNKEIGAYLRERTVKRAQEQGKPVGREAMGNYRADLANITTARNKAIEANDAAYQAGVKDGEAWTGEKWRKANADILKRAAISRQQAGESWFGVTGREELKTAIDRASGADPNRKGDRTQELIDEYYGLQPEAETSAGLQKFYDERKTWLENLKRDNPAEYAEFKRAQDARLTPIQKEYARASELMGVYMEIPSYRGLSVEESRRISALLGRASDRVRAGLARNQRQALLMDTQDPDLIMTARRAQGGRLTNRERSYFFRSHPELSRFYSGLLSEEVDRIAGVA